MELLLPFNVAPSPIKISYADKIIFIGSCFSEEIGKQMKDVKFNVLQNPNGILYDPASICSSLNSCIENKVYKEEDLFLLNGVWHSWQHHSSFSGLNKAEVLKNINQSQSKTKQFLQDASWIVITPGTSYNYQLKETGEAVANCHKAHSGYFEKKLISTEGIINDFSEVISSFQSFNPKLKIIFTVSPVRHVKDGIIENNRSKARLIEAIHSIKERYKNVFYFPAYELVIDVLRDYRFYKNDLVHPSETATAFVFEKFCETFIEESSAKLLEEVKTIIAAKNHKPFQSESIEHKKFQQVQLDKIKRLITKAPHLDFSQEEKFFSGNQ